jgi:hypothetical protein
LDEKTKDGDLDAVLHFGPSSMGSALTDTEICIRSQYAAPGGQHSGSTAAAQPVK